tara:strand:+ start:2654 stop:3259 length:606 start_codon:yes stop_codon:yes gene_type:complete
MTSILPKRIIADREQLIAQMIKDMSNMTAEEFIDHFQTNNEKYKNMEMMTSKKKKIVIGVIPFKLQSVTPWTLYSSSYINDHRGDEKLTLERCGVLRKEAAVIWKASEVDHDIFINKAKEQNNENYANWQKYYHDHNISIPNNELSAYLKSIDNIKVMKRKELTHFCGLLESIRTNTEIVQNTPIKELRKLLIEVFKKIDD